MLEFDWMGLGVLVAGFGAVAWRIAVKRIASPDPDRGGPVSRAMQRVGACGVVIGICVAIAAAFAKCS